MSDNGRAKTRHSKAYVAAASFGVHDLRTKGAPKLAQAAASALCLAAPLGFSPCGSE